MHAHHVGEEDVAGDVVEFLASDRHRSLHVHAQPVHVAQLSVGLVVDGEVDGGVAPHVAPPLRWGELLRHLHQRRLQPSNRFRIVFRE